MNNFQNCSAGRFVSPRKIVANYSESYGSGRKNGKQDTRGFDRCSKPVPSGALKIFYESRNFSDDEPQFEWSLKNVKKKSSRNVALTAEEKTKSRKNWKNWKKIQEKESQTETKFKKPNYLAIIESQLAKSKTGSIKSHTKPELKFSSHLINGKDSKKIREISERNIPLAAERAAVDCLYALPKVSANVGRRLEKVEINIRPKGSTTCGLAEKSWEKAGDKTPDVKATISDYGKRHINEILKSHAQKVHGTQVKAYQAVQNGSSGTRVNEVKTEKNEEKKAKTQDKAVKDAKKSKENQSTDTGFEEKKKLPGTWMSLPQSNELERRLVNSWQAPKSLFLHDKDLNVDELSEEEKIPKKSENHEQEEEKKTEKRTYTDRLLQLKKNSEEKKHGTSAEGNGRECNSQEVRKVSSKEKQESPTKKPENAKTEPGEVKSQSVSFIKEVPDKRELVLLKNDRLSDTEHVLKTKQTRSTELRDLVTQAIKEHKIFCIFDNHSYIVRPVREELLSRGWLEVIPDRRLIPRRRPPPMGPTYERDKAVVERNCNTLEAILAAKENFADEIQETVSRSSSFKLAIEKPKIATAALVPSSKKVSEDSLAEVLSLFRITPPNLEKKKNNVEIREFSAKYQALIDKENEREIEIKKLKEKEKIAKNQRKEKSKLAYQNSLSQSKPEEKQIFSNTPPLLSSRKSLQAILDSLNDNKEVIMHAAAEIKNIDGRTGENLAVGVLFDSAAKNAPHATEKKAREDKEAAEDKEKAQKMSAKESFFSESEAKTISKIIQSSNARIQFMWLSIKPGIHLKCFNYSPEIINKFQKTTFCTKIGLWSHLSNIQWYAHEVSYPAKSPRMYNTGEADDLHAFFQDFQLTACISILKWFSETFFEKGLKAIQTKKGKVPLKALEFAIKQCERYIRFKDNEDLTIHDEPKVHDEEWNVFLQWFYTITNDRGKIQETSSAQLMVVYTKAVETLKMMRRHWPEIDIDGQLNIWIMKPYCASCGRGIFMTNNVYYIGQHSKYIVQKYIEKPLLIYNTKFDIRQWFMITKLTPLEIWMYRECYLRFCTQPFALRNLHESVHLSNNSVQRKYISHRDPSLPDQNMWDSNTFQLYLKTIGHPNVWEDIIYPGMRDAIVSTMLAAQDTFDGPRKSWFEVYGADFMLSSNLKDGPWLIEINENPAMDPSTKVTERLCPQMLRDVIKVVVDKRSNKNASTGQWELIYRQNFSPSFGLVDIDVRGKKIARVPHTTKVSLSVRQNSAISPSNSKKLGSDEMGKYYEIVKVFGGNEKNEGEDFDESRGRRKLMRSKALNVSESHTRSTDALKKYKIQSHTSIKTNLSKRWINLN